MCKALAMGASSAYNRGVPVIYFIAVLMMWKDCSRPQRAVGGWVQHNDCYAHPSVKAMKGRHFNVSRIFPGPLALV